MKLHKITDLNVLVEALLEIRTKKQEVNNELARLAERERLIEARILDVMREQGLDGAKLPAVGVTLSRTTRLVPQALDWAAIEQFVRQTGRLDILQRRLSTTVLRAMAENDDLPPGVAMIELTGLSVRTIRSGKLSNLFAEEESE